MRIACVYLPSFPLQAHIRRAPHLAGTALAIVDSRPTGSTVLACSRAAWARGVRVGMPIAVARAGCPELAVVNADPALYRDALQAAIESLLCHCDAVDAGAELDAVTPHRALYLEVPPRSRGASFGQKLISQLSRQGLRGRVGVADDRFTAHIAAVEADTRPGRSSGYEAPAGADCARAPRLDDLVGQPALFQQSCTVVPRGGGAAFLAPLPLGHLPIDPDIRHLLETCGVKTLGDFAELPPPSVARDRIAPENDYQALARGQGPATLSPLDLEDVLSRALTERIDLAYELSDYQPLSFILRTLCDRVSHRLGGRDRAARVLELSLTGPPPALSPGQDARAPGEPGRPDSVVEIELARPGLSGRELLDAIRKRLHARGLPHPVVAVELRVAGEAEPTDHELDLFDQPRSARAGAGRAAEDGESESAMGLISKSAPMAHQRPGARDRAAGRGRQQLLRLIE